MQGAAAEERHRARALRSQRRAFRTGLLLSVVVHGALLAIVAVPRSDLRWGGGAEWEILEVEAPPRVEVPPPPETVSRPSPPEVTDVEVVEPGGASAEPVAAPPPGARPEPPRVTTASPDQRSALAPPDVAPSLESPEHFRRRLERSYPRLLRDRGVGGVVRLQFFVDPRGEVSRVQVAESSGHASLDRVATRMAGEMRFLPALNRDRAVGVWVSQRICFMTVDRRGDRPSAAECEHQVALGGG